MRINQNIPALNTQNNLKRVDSNLSASLEKLSSGLRINRASDDAGGLAVSEALRAQVRGLAMAEKSAQDGLALINTAEAVQDSVHEMLQRAREIAVYASNGFFTAGQRNDLSIEITEIIAEVTRLGTATEFNGITVFAAAGQIIQVGPDNQADHQITLTTGTLAANSVGTAAIDINGSDLTSAANARATIDLFDQAIDSLSQSRATLGAQANRLEYTITTLQSTRENIAAAESRIRDVDMAEEMTNLTRNQILLQSSTAMVAQANVRPQTILALLR